MSRMGVWNFRNGPSGGTSSTAAGWGTSGISASCGVWSTTYPVAASSPWWMKGGDLEEVQGNVHAPVHRVEVTEDGAGEDHDPAAVLGGVLLEVGLQTEPQLQSLVELGRLRCRI